MRDVVSLRAATNLPKGCCFRFNIGIFISWQTVSMKLDRQDLRILSRLRAASQYAEKQFPVRANRSRKHHDGGDRRVAGGHDGSSDGALTRNRSAMRLGSTAPDGISDATPAFRVPAQDLEDAVRKRVTSFLSDKAELRRELMLTEAAALSRVTAACANLADEPQRRDWLRSIIERVELGEGTILVLLRRNGLRTFVSLQVAETDVPIILAAAAVRVRRGQEVGLLLRERSDDGISRATTISSSCSGRRQSRSSSSMHRLRLASRR